ncbi:MAG: 30S ribosomal protein S18 [Candidatus Omnitrophota bacterium]
MIKKSFAGRSTGSGTGRGAGRGAGRGGGRNVRGKVFTLKKENEFGLPRKKVCRFCIENVKAIDYKDTKRLEKFINERGKMISRRATGACTKHQRGLGRAIKLTRYMALLPYVRT